ncbi:MAG: hypothetical protein ACPIOQ_20835, partial [Promethearchaeia archaeon]
GASGHGRAVGILDGRGAGFRTVLVNAAHAAGIMREKRPADREGADGRLKHIVIDKVYFPKDREDAGIAAVHGWINGNFVQGDLQLQRTAKYNAADGSWLGVPNRPPRLSTYKSAVEGVVAHSIRAAMQSLSTHKQQVPPTSLVKLNSLGRDPETALTIDIAKAAHQAVEEVLNAESAHETVAKLKARRARVFQLKRVRRRLPSSQLRARWRRPGPKSKTLRGCTCLAPCSRRGGQRAWCFTAGSCGFQARRAGSSASAAGQFWDHCEPELVRTVKGCECDFPFEFQGSRMHACIDSSRTFLWGAEAPPHSGQPRGIWCKTKGDCGAGEFTPAKGLRSVKWDHCDLPPTHADTAQSVASAARLSSLATPAGGGVARPLQGQQGQGRACGATIGDARARKTHVLFARVRKRRCLCIRLQRSGVLPGMRRWQLQMRGWFVEGGSQMRPAEQSPSSLLKLPVSKWTVCFRVRRHGRPVFPVQRRQLHLCLIIRGWPGPPSSIAELYTFSNALCRVAHV